MHFKAENITIPFVQMSYWAKLLNDLLRIIQAEATEGNTGQANTLTTEPTSPLTILNKNKIDFRRKKEEDAYLNGQESSR